VILPAKVGGPPRRPTPMVPRQRATGTNLVSPLALRPPLRQARLCGILLLLI